jgi:hypothetical protein
LAILPIAAIGLVALLFFFVDFFFVFAMSMTPRWCAQIVFRELPWAP